jgi:hypothetical protein
MVTIAAEGSPLGDGDLRTLTQVALVHRIQDRLVIPYHAPKTGNPKMRPIVLPIPKMRFSGLKWEKVMP